MLIFFAARQQDSLKIFALDCSKWKEQHGCEGGLIRDLCKKTCDLCGKPHEANLVYQILKNTQIFHYFTHFAENDPKPKPQCESKNCCKTEYDGEYHCERVCCDDENTLGPIEHCKGLGYHDLSCLIISQISSDGSFTFDHVTPTLTQALDDNIKCTCQWNGVVD